VGFKYSVRNVITEIISGGQTGADRAALDVAIRNRFPYSGWCPKGRRAEGGVIGSQYKLKETPVAGYLQRNEWNVRDSEGTVILTFSAQLSGGSKKTAEFAQKLGRPWIHIARSPESQSAASLRIFVEENHIAKLNVAGSRESKEPGIHQWVCDVIEDAFFRGTKHPCPPDGSGEG